MERKAKMTTTKTVNEKDTAETASQNENSKQIVLQPNHNVNVYTQAQLDLIKSTVAKGATNDEFKLFIVVAKRTGLDPFSKQIHFVKRGSQGTIQTGIDGYRAIAERSGTLAGIDDAIYDDEKAQHPNKASVTVYRIINGLRVPFTASARWQEYCPKPPNDFMWKKMPYLMLAKCAEALALRKAFPNDLSGLYTNEEMGQSETQTMEIKQVNNVSEKHWDNKPETIQNPKPHQEPKLSELAEKIIATIEVCFSKEEIFKLGEEINKFKKEKGITAYEWEMIKPKYLNKLKEFTK